MRWLDRTLVLLVAATLTLFTYAIIKGDGPGSGDNVLIITRENGLNSGDLPAVGLWAVSMLACGALLWRGRG